MIKINQEKCFVDKRCLVLDCDITGYFVDGRKEETRNYRFEVDGWNWEKEKRELRINGELAKSSMPKVLNSKDWPAFVVITNYKHCLQACFAADDDNTVFIDRRYEHNSSFDVYYKGVAYLVGSELSSNSKEGEA